MHDTAGVRRRQCLRYLVAIATARSNGMAPRRKRCRNVSPSTNSVTDKGMSAVVAEIVDDENVRVIQRRCSTSFQSKAVQLLGVRTGLPRGSHLSATGR